MARQTGSNNFAGTLEVQAGGPLDARSVVPTKADLTASGNFPYSYIGMQVAVQSEGKAYMLTGADPTVAANWKAVGSDIQIDSVPTAESTNAVSSGGVYASLAGKVNTNDVGVASGIAELDANGKVPASQLPSYVDDVIEGYYKVADGKFYEESTYETEITGEDGKIYISVDTDIQYRWTGTAFSALGGALVLGETSSTAYRGDRGKTAYDDSQANKANIGTMANLATTEKSSLVGAVNEVTGELAGKADSADLQTVATSGAFDDLTNRPQEGVTPISSLVTPLPGFKTFGAKYSTSEQVVGEWIDGKPIYKKTFTFGALSDSPSAWATTAFQNIGASVDKLIFSEGALCNNDGLFSDFTEGSSDMGIHISFYNNASSNANKNKVAITYKGNLSWVSSVWATIYYTKTTD